MSLAPFGTGAGAVPVAGARPGMWRFYAYWKGNRIDITRVRGAETKLESLSTTDPGGMAEATLTFGAVTAIEPRGAGSDTLFWLQDETHVDIVWTTYNPDAPEDRSQYVEYPQEGYMLSPEGGMIGQSVSCVGAIKQFDNYLAKPEYPYQPRTYEWAISHALRPRVDTPTQPVKVIFPDDWDLLFDPKEYPTKKPWMVPEGGPRLRAGQPWTKMLTRETGKFEESWSSYVQGLLANMQSERGMWTVMMMPGRQPVLKVREIPAADDPRVLRLSLLNPGLVNFRWRRDSGQKTNAVFAQGKSQSGSVFSGMRVALTEDSPTYYEPYAFAPQVHPQEHNDWLDRTVMRKETSISLPEGMTEAEGARVAQLAYQRFNDPGVTGTFTLKADLINNAGVVEPRQTYTAGRAVLLEGFLGEPLGTLAHIVETKINGAGDLDVTFDTRFRDQLTVQEVRRRGRDSMKPARMLTVGNYEPNVPDLLLPGSYDHGSGYVPSVSFPLWRGTRSQPHQYEDVPFPWTELTRARPPKDPAWAHHYARIGPVDYGNSGRNWAVFKPGSTFPSYPVILASAGDIRLFQMAAYDEDGNVLPVSFHVSVYYSDTVRPTHMPKIPSTPRTYVKDLNKRISRPADGVTYHYKAGQPYPFFGNAFNTGYNEDGTKVISTNQVSAAAQLIVGYGNGQERAGFWPGNQESGGRKTGLMSEEGGFSFDFLTNTTRFPGNGFRQLRESEKRSGLVSAFMMIYCEDQGDEPVYFLGRMYRAEPGTR